jgi:hypothetical protein
LAAEAGMSGPDMKAPPEGSASTSPRPEEKDLLKAHGLETPDRLPEAASSSVHGLAASDRRVEAVSSSAHGLAA